MRLLKSKKTFQADIAAQHVNGVIAANGKRIAVAGRNPNFEVRANRLYTSGNRGRTAVNGVKAERIHVIRKTAGAADTGDHNKILTLDAEVGKNRLNGGKNGVVAATGAPANFLVRLKIFLGERRG